MPLSTDFIGFPKQPYIVLGPYRSPGVATVKGATSPRTWNTPQGFGVDGSTATFIGTKLAKFDVEIKLWLPEQFIAWDLFAALALAKPASFGPGTAKTPVAALGAMGVQHPLINGPPLNIKEVVVEDVTQFDQSDTGLWTCTIKLLEYKKPIPRFARPIAAIPAVAVPQPTAQDAGEIEMQILVDEATGLAG